MSRRLGLLLLALAGASVLCVALSELRSIQAGDSRYRFLVWNLVLAWIPVGLAVAAFVRSRLRVDAGVAALVVLWLLFFPNAPYMLTDFIHLGEGHHVPLWYDGLMLSAFAWTAVLLGFVSLYLVQAVVRTWRGPRWGWGGVALALALASIGVYIGRFLRVNSWDALLHPLSVARIIGERVQEETPRAALAVVGLSGFLLAGYLVVLAFVGLRLEPDRLEP